MLSMGFACKTLDKRQVATDWYHSNQQLPFMFDLTESIFLSATILGTFGHYANSS